MADKQLLIQPFPAETIRQRPGSGRNVFDYIAGGDVIARVIEATDNTFGWTVDHVEMIQQNGLAYWLVRGTLTIPELGSRDGIGTHPAESVDAPKAAETDAIKRAAVKFGVALHLYTDDPVANGKDAAVSHAANHPNEDAAVSHAANHPNEDRVTRIQAERPAVPQPLRYERDEYSQVPPEPVRRHASYAAANAPCSECHAPEGRPHATRCPVRNGR